MDEILLTIVVPSYNQGQFIRETLAEPLKLRHRGVQTIVIDGGSTDNTREILHELEGDIDYWASEEDRGQAHAINKGFARAKGHWIAFQNSDDFYLPGALERVLKVMASNPRADVLLGGAAFVDLEGKLLRNTLPKPLFVPCLSQMNFVQNQALFVRASLIAKVGVLDEKAEFCLDYEWFLRIFKPRPTVRLLNFYVGAQRLHDDTKTAKNQHIHDREFERFTTLHFTPWERRLGKVTLPFYRLFRRGYRIVRAVI